MNELISFLEKSRTFFRKVFQSFKFHFCCDFKYFNDREKMIFLLPFTIVKQCKQKIRYVHITVTKYLELLTWSNLKQIHVKFDNMEVNQLYMHLAATWKKNNIALQQMNYPAGNYMFKVSNRSTRTRCEICSKLTIKTPNDTDLCWSLFLWNLSLESLFNFIKKRLQHRSASFWCLYSKLWTYITPCLVFLLLTFSR